MEIRKIVNEITFGIEKVPKGFRVITDIRMEKGFDGKERMYYNAITTLIYKNERTALKKSESFVRSMYKPFSDFQGRQVEFNFINKGLIVKND